MVTYLTKIKIDKPIEEVFKIISDHSKATAWLTGLKDVKLTNDLIHEKGAKAQYTFEERGREIVFNEELLDIQAPTQFSYRLESPQVVMESETHLTSIDGSTEVKMQNSVRGKGFLIKLFIPLMKKSMIKRQVGDLQNLKQLIEEHN